MNPISHRLSSSKFYFLVNGLWAILRNIAVIIPGFFVGPVLARVFTDPSDIGVYDLVLTLSSFFALGVIPGLQQLVSQSASKGRDGAFREAIRAGFLGMLFTFPLAIFTAYLYKQQGQGVVSGGLLIVSFFLVFTSPLRIYESFLQGKKRFDLIATFAGINALLTSIVTVGFAMMFTSVLHILVGIAMMNLVTTAFFAWYTRRFVENDGREKGQIRYGIFLSSLSIIPLLAARLDKVLLVGFFSPAQLGLYYFATVIPAQTQRFMQSLVDVTYPRIAPMTKKEHVEVLKRHGLKVILFSLAVSVSLVFLMPFVIPFLFTERYQEIIFFAQLEALSFALFAPNLFLANMLTAERRVISQFWLSTIPAVLKIGAAFILIPLLGIPGIILVNALSRVMATGISLFTLLRRE